MAVVLVIDGGGRGSVLVDKYVTSPQVSKVLTVPGNDLMVRQKPKPVEIFPKFKTTDIEAIKQICQKYKVDLVDVSQDDAIAAGVCDELQNAGFMVLGPTRLAGQIEWDKAWAREFMQKFGLPIPRFKICRSQKEGINFVKSQENAQWFVKAAGLAAGKGAIFADAKKEAVDAIYQMQNFGEIGKTFLIEECLYGEEFSSFAIVDGENFILVGHAQDHKRVFNGDLGPNTGGMGCASPPLVINKKIEDQIKAIFQKTVAALVKIKRPYRGILYLGGMIDKSGKVFVIEFNARWGDPEAQVIVPSIKNDFYKLAVDTIYGRLKKIQIIKDNLYRVAVTAASSGYPDDYSKVRGKQIFGLDYFLRHSGAQAIESVKIFGAGVKKDGTKYIANGGRLFYVLASGKNVCDARQKAYSALSQIYIEGNNLHYRTDIGWRDVERGYR